MKKKILHFMFVNTPLLGTNFTLIFLAEYNKLYIYAIPLLLSYIALIVYILVYKQNINYRHILLHIVFDLLLLLIMIWAFYFQILQLK